ncbi:hypothetical protein [Neglectibacter timonensis]|uniref:hypothetical protein n=1 Tax=Neglectibacter timonensis TaxID=1776382 RepID=UPI003AB1411A
MAEKAKFDREAAFKSIIGAGRQSENAVVAEEKMQRKIVTGCSGPIIWIGILIRRYVGWRWRKERI